jgi:hypothetical protein
MKRLLIVFLLALITLSAGCTEDKNDTTEISDDAIITHLTYGAFTLPEMAVQELIVNSTAVNLSYYNYDNELTARYIKPIDEQTRNDLLDLMRNNEFTGMKELYVPQEGQPIVTDTGTLEITVVQEGMNKTVKVDPYFDDYMPADLREINDALVDLRSYALSISGDEAKVIAEDWIKNAPTYSYDGSDLVLEDYRSAENYPEEHILTYSFTSSHGGYGNRTGQMVAQVITNHTIEVTLYNSNVVSAIIDGVWDEREQNMLEFIRMDSEQMNCTQAPWQLWYAEGNINFIQEPTGEELAIAYFSTVHGIEVSDLSSANLEDGMCRYGLTVKTESVPVLEGLGWQKA